MSYSVVIKRQILSILTKKNNLAFAGSLISIKVNDFSVICIRKIRSQKLAYNARGFGLEFNTQLYTEPYSLYIHKLHAKKINMYYPEETWTCTYWFNLLYTKLYIKQFLHLYVHLYKTKTKALSDYKCGLICTRYICICIQMKEKCRYM